MEGPPLWPADAPIFVSQMRKLMRTNRTKARRLYPDPISRSEALLNAHHAFASEHVWTFEVTRPNPTPTEQLLFSAVAKNELALFSILELTQAGFFGSVRPLLRQVFEFQVLAKYAAVDSTGDIARRWLRGDVPAIGRDVFPRLGQPVAGHLRTFWRTLHPFVHASPHSQQVSPHMEHNFDELGVDLMLFSLVLHNQFHILLQLAFNPRSKRLAVQYSPRGRMTRLRRTIGQHLSRARPHYSAEGKALVRSFRTRWVPTSKIPVV
jgi:hypothetical protein